MEFLSAAAAALSAERFEPTVDCYALPDVAQQRPSRRRSAGWPARALVVGAAWLLLLAACTPSPPRHVVLISVDSLRADHLGAYGYPRPTSPHIDRLAREGTLVERALSSTSWTLPAHVALFTGLPDGLHGVQRGNQALGPRLPTLADRLAAAGFATGAVVSGPYLAPRFGLARGFEDYLNCMSYLDDDFRPRSGAALDVQRASHGDVTGACVVERATRWLEQHRGERAFLFLHFWDVHYDYQPPEQWVKRFDPDYRGALDASGFAHNPAVHAGMDPRDLEHLIALYDGEIAYTDARIGELLAALETLGIADRTLVVLLSDHGDAFFEHGVKGHLKDLHRESVEIPLVLRGPGVPAGRRLPGPASITDVATTVLELAGVRRPALGDGTSLVAAFDDPAALAQRFALTELTAENGRFAAIESLDRKLVRHLDSGATRAYDLAADPDEQRPLDPEPELVRRLEARLEAHRERARSLPSPERVRLTPTLEEKLRALGYAQPSRP